MIGGVTGRIRNWISGLFIAAIKGMSRPEDQESAVRWLGLSRDVLASHDTLAKKAIRLNALINSRAAARAIGSSVVTAVANYRQSSLPLPVKIAIPATLAAIPLVGAQGAGVAAFGSAIGMPVLLLVFLGVSGLTSIIEVFVKDPASRDAMVGIVETILKHERARQASAELRAAMADAPVPPKRGERSADTDLSDWLHSMDPYDFERHVMSFFEAAGLATIVTPRSNDCGVDGIASTDGLLIVVQCKRNAPDNRVGRPVVQQFKGVVEEHGASRGYIVTTASFTAEAIASASLTDKIILVDMDRLAGWHRQSPTFDAP